MTDQVAEIDVPRALQLLEQAVAQRGADYAFPRFTNCVYVLNDKPACLIGLALHLGGVSIERMYECNSVPVSGLPKLMRFITADAAQVFQTAQYKQDCGKTWGEALDAARSFVAEKLEKDR